MSTTAALPDPVPSLEDLLEQARHRIEVTDPELDEARKRRNAIAAALRQEFPGCRIYFNGSLAHGDALTPLVDIDLGVVVPDPQHRHGPGGRGPRELQDRAAEAIRAGLKPLYGDLRVEVEGRKRSVLVRFRDPVRPGWADFTADVIVAIDNPGLPGLFIPRYDTWDRSHPEKHTDLVLAAIERTKVSFPRAIRLLKHWARHLNEPPLCSWHIKALALDCFTRPTTMLDALQVWFTYAAEALNQGDTPDPAHVGPGIKTPQSRQETVRQLAAAARQLQEAITLEREGWHVLAHEELAKLFGDPEMLPRPALSVVRAEEAARLRARSVDDRRRALSSVTTGSAARPAVRSWAP